MLIGGIGYLMDTLGLRSVGKRYTWVKVCSVLSTLPFAGVKIALGLAPLIPSRCC